VVYASAALGRPQRSAPHHQRDRIRSTYVTRAGRHPCLFPTAINIRITLSFSSAKKFELPLAAVTAQLSGFRQGGLGHPRCKIHDDDWLRCRAPDAFFGDRTCWTRRLKELPQGHYTCGTVAPALKGQPEDLRPKTLISAPGKRSVLHSASQLPSPGQARARQEAAMS